jgi:hypothetical protein
MRKKPGRATPIESATGRTGRPGRRVSRRARGPLSRTISLEGDDARAFVYLAKSLGGVEAALSFIDRIDVS